MKISLFLICCFWSIASQASQTAITDEGEIVILRDDGTWVFENPDALELTEIPINNQEFAKSKSSSFRLKSTKNDSEVWLDPKKWTFEKGGANGETEYSFQLRGEDVYAMLITEKISMNMENLTEIALQNAVSAAPDMKVTKREYRDVNGIRAIYMEMQGTAQGAKFTFSGYYFSDNSGSTQFVTYTGTNLHGGYRTEIEAFLNGLSVQ